MVNKTIVFIINGEMLTKILKNKILKRYKIRL